MAGKVRRLTCGGYGELIVHASLLRILGKNLRELALGFQSRLIEFVRTMPDHYAALSPAGGAIGEIRVEEIT